MQICTTPARNICTYILENVIYAAALTNNDDEKKDTLHAYLAPQGVKFFV